MFQGNSLLGRGFKLILMKNQVLFSLKDKSKKLKCCYCNFFGTLRVKTCKAILKVKQRGIGASCNNIIMQTVKVTIFLCENCLLHGPSMLAFDAKIYGVLHNQSS